MANEIGSSIIGAAGNIITTAMQNHANRKLQSEQNAYNYDLWQQQNAYNDPSAAMQRMINAGINPDAAAQGISGSSGNYTDATVAKQDTLPHMENIGQTLGNSINSIWQNQLLQQQVEKLMLENGRYNEVTDETLANIRADTAEKLSKSGLNDAQKKQALDMLDLFKGRNAAELAQISAATNKIIAETQKVESDIKVNEQSIEESKSREALNNEKVNTEKTIQAVNDSTATLNAAQTSETEQRTKNEEQQFNQNAWKDLFIETWHVAPDSPQYAQLMEMARTPDGREAISIIANCQTGMAVHNKYESALLGFRRTMFPNFNFGMMLNPYK